MNISELKIMRSNAGWYIGRTYEDEGMELPYSRESYYYASYKAILTAFNNETINWR